MTKFPWVRAMEIGFGHLRLAPDQFWCLTLPELAAAARGMGLGHPRYETIGRPDFDALIRRFPDGTPP